MKLRIEYRKSGAIREEHELAAHRVTIVGRLVARPTDPDATYEPSDVDIAIDDVTLSRRHFRIGHSESGWWIEDAGSASGIRVNGESATAGRTLVTEADAIQVGNFVMRLVP
jgi:pSer/pThr/pTyr-binding forkhead associated (FHA) protein